MDRAKTNRVTMYKTVAGVLDQNNSVWSGMAPFAAAVDQFKNKIAGIDAAAQKQETPVSGVTGDKAATRDELEDVLFLMCEALGVLGHTTNDHELEALVALSPSAIDNLGDEELSNRAATVQARANAKKTELAALQVTQANIDELEQALQNFQAAKAKPRTAVVERAVQTESLSSLVREAGNILRDQIDRLVNLFRRSHPEFVAEYRSARVVVDRVASHATPKTATGAPTPPTT
ncbi:MAG: hypothetical protein H7Z16_07350 [Pyrinomonadaceae bacterium]|nr:hypothetical protein [Pyrinomonadaceae bacterium]